MHTWVDFQCDTGAPMDCAFYYQEDHEEDHETRLTGMYDSSYERLRVIE